MAQTNAMDTLIEQNQELQARLNLSLKKQESLERQLVDQIEAFKKVQRDSQSFEDRLALLREKEFLLKGKLEHLELQDTELNKLRGVLTTKESQLVRFKKYADKMRQQIRPYLKNLKEYIQGQSLRIQNLEALIHERDQFIKKIHLDNEYKSAELHSAQQFYEENQNQLFVQWSKEKQKLSTEIEVLQAQLQEASSKIEKHQHLVAREDELENLLIAQSRVHSDELKSAHEENESLKLEVQNSQSQILQLNKSLDLQRLESDTKQSQIDILKLKLDSSEKQIETLRILWRERNPIAPSRDEEQVNNTYEKLKADLSENLENEIRGNSLS